VLGQKRAVVRLHRRFPPEQRRRRRIPLRHRRIRPRKEQKLADSVAHQDYGLFAPNNLYFKGPVTIKEGEKLEYSTGCFHSGDVSAAELNNRYVTYLNA
jgi:hypothetical protein